MCIYVYIRFVKAAWREGGGVYGSVSRVEGARGEEGLVVDVGLE